MSCGCARWLCGRTPRDGAGKYARVQLDEPEDDEDDDYCDASPEANPWEALQQRRNLDFDVDEEPQAAAEEESTPGAAPGAAVAGTEDAAGRADQATGGRAGTTDASAARIGADASSGAQPGERAGRRWQLGDMEIDVGWKAAGSGARGSIQQTAGGRTYGQGQAHPPEMAKLIGRGTPHPTMKFDPSRRSGMGRTAEAKVKLAGLKANLRNKQSNWKAALERAKDRRKGDLT